MNKILKVVLVSTALLTSVSSYAGQVVIVNPANAAALDKSVISRIFLGKLKKFPDGSSVVPVNQKSGSVDKSTFDEKALGKSSSQIKAYWSKLMFSGKGKPPKEFSSDGDVKSFVAKEANAIGYIDEASVDDTVKVVFKF